MRYSKQKDVIYTILKNTNKHPNADVVYRLAKNSIPSLSLGTVYRNLKTLSVNGEVITISINGMVHYDANVVPHSHFYCVKCKCLTDVDFKSEGTNALDKQGYTVKTEEILMTGICVKCNSLGLNESSK